MATTEKVQQPKWQVPVPAEQEPKLKVWNSLTRTKVCAITGMLCCNAYDIACSQNEFMPMHGKRVDWYNCGPTVYDSAHMGHAR